MKQDATDIIKQLITISRELYSIQPVYANIILDIAEGLLLSIPADQNDRGEEKPNKTSFENQSSPSLSNTTKSNNTSCNLCPSGKCDPMEELTDEEKVRKAILSALKSLEE